MLATGRNAGVNTGRQASLQQHFLRGNTQYKDYWTTPFLTFWGNSILISFIEIVYIPPTVCKEIHLLFKFWGQVGMGTMSNQIREVEGVY